VSTITIYKITREHQDPAVTPLIAFVRGGTTVSCLCSVAGRPVERAIENVQVGDVIMVMPVLDAYYPVTAIDPTTVEE
jgi:hypothetical protein